MALTVADLLDVLAGADPDAEIRMMHQPSYPMESQVASAVIDEDEETGSTVVRVCEGTWVGYASSGSWA